MIDAFTTPTYKIVVKDVKPVHILPFGDVHYGTITHAEEHFNAWIAASKRFTNAHYLGMGDYFDFLSKSERSIVTNTGLHESTRMDIEAYVLDLVKKLAKKLAHIKGRCIGLLEGNHHFVFSDGTSSTQRLCNMLHTDYLGSLSHIRVQFDLCGAQRALDIYAHHGKGASRLLGGSLSRVQQMAESAIADIYLMGHDHKLNQGKSDRLYRNANGRLVHKTVVFLRTGSFQKGFVPNVATYVARNAMNPATLGAPYITVTPHRESSRTKTREMSLDLATTI